jgi:hypothetical protein
MKTGSRRSVVKTRPSLEKSRQGSMRRCNEHCTKYGMQSLEKVVHSVVAYANGFDWPLDESVLVQELLSSINTRDLCTVLAILIVQQVPIVTNPLIIPPWLAYLQCRGRMQ